VVYFYNVYGKRQVYKGDMAVFGIFEDCFRFVKKLPGVRPGTQERRIAYVFDTVKDYIFV
jgi:UDP-glucose 4-epimerase